MSNERNNEEPPYYDSSSSFDSSSFRPVISNQQPTGNLLPTDMPGGHANSDDRELPTEPIRFGNPNNDFNWNESFHERPVVIYDNVASTSQYNPGSILSDSFLARYNYYASMSINSLTNLERNIEELTEYLTASQIPPVPVSFVTPPNNSDVSSHGHSSTLSSVQLSYSQITNSGETSFPPEQFPTRNQSYNADLPATSTSLLSNLERNIEESLANYRPAPIPIGTPCYLTPMPDEQDRNITPPSYPTYNLFPAPEDNSLLSNITPPSYPTYSPLPAPENSNNSFFLAELISSGKLISRPDNQDMGTDNAPKSPEYSTVLKKKVSPRSSNMPIRDDPSYSPWGNLSTTPPNYGNQQPMLPRQSMYSTMCRATSSETETVSTIVPDSFPSGSASVVTTLPQTANYDTTTWPFLEFANSMPPTTYGCGLGIVNQRRSIFTMSSQSTVIPRISPYPTPNIRIPWQEAMSPMQGPIYSKSPEAALPVIEMITSSFPLKGKDSSNSSDSGNSKTDSYIMKKPRRYLKPPQDEPNKINILSESLKELTLLTKSLEVAEAKSEEGFTSEENTVSSGSVQLDSTDPGMFNIDSRSSSSSGPRNEANTPSGSSDREPRAIRPLQQDPLAPSGSSDGTNQPERDNDNASGSSSTTDQSFRTAGPRVKPKSVKPKSLYWKRKYFKR